MKENKLNLVDVVHETAFDRKSMLCDAVSPWFTSSPAVPGFEITWRNIHDPRCQRFDDRASETENELG